MCGYPKIEIGLRVKTIKPIDRFPDFLLDETELKGTVNEVNDDGIWVKMDKHIPELDEWDNCINFPDIEGGMMAFWFDMEVLPISRE